MTFEALMKELKAGKRKPVYLLEGEEDFFIDRAAEFFEKQMLSDAEKEFNLTVFYGKDADWATVVNACRRYPMFGDKQVVILKEAQSMKTLDKLELYLRNPLENTVLVITFKHGKMDGRTTTKKLIDKIGAVLTTKRLYDNKLPEWIKNYASQQGHDITQKACMLLTDHIGNDLARQASEIDKLLLNLPPSKKIDEDDIERYVGISKEFNIFEYQKAIGQKDHARVMRILNYFKSNPKAAPPEMVLPVLYAFFSKVHMVVQFPGKPEAELAQELRVTPYFMGDYIRCARLYRQSGVERALLLLYEYNLRVVGVHDGGTPKSELLREMSVRIMH